MLAQRVDGQPASGARGGAGETGPEPQAACRPAGIGWRGQGAAPVGWGRGVERESKGEAAANQGGVSTGVVVAGLCGAKQK